MATTGTSMRVRALCRHVVKSFQGQVVDTAEIGVDGLDSDRCWGVRDEATGKILTGRRAPELLHARAALTDGGVPRMTLPTGETCEGPGPETDAALTRWLGKPVALVSSAGAPGAPAEYFADATDDSSAAIEWQMPAGRFVDALALLVLTTASLRAAAALYPDGDWDVRRFRPNLLLDVRGTGWLEDTWCDGQTLKVGDAELVPRQQPRRQLRRVGHSPHTRARARRRPSERPILTGGCKPSAERRVSTALDAGSV